MNPTREQLLASGISEEAADRVLAALEAEAVAPAADVEPPDPAIDQALAQTDENAAAVEQNASEPDQEHAEAKRDTAESDQEDAAAASAPAPDDAPADEAAPSREAAPDVAAIEAENQRLRAQLADALVAQAGAQLGVKPERVGALRKLADLSQIDPASENLPAQVLKAVEAALKEVPELAGPPANPGSLGNHPRESANPVDPFTRGFRG